MYVHVVTCINMLKILKESNIDFIRFEYLKRVKHKYNLDIVT